jgi:hypothetical protein
VVEPLSELRGKWVLVTFDARRATRTASASSTSRAGAPAQGKDMERIERLWVITDAGKPRATCWPRPKGQHREKRDLREGFPANREYIYLVDPLGNLMMRFPARSDPSQVIKDLQRLLKYSRFG